jgi:hypothetical protein
MLDHREQLDGEHRQHARHEIEDQSADERQAQDHRERAGQRTFRGHGPGEAGDHVLLHAAPAVDHGEGQTLAFDSARLRGGQRGQAQDRGRAAFGQSDLRLAEGEAGRRLDQDVRGLEGDVRARRDLKHRGLGRAGQDRPLEGQADACAVARHQGPIAVDQKTIARRPGAAGRHGERECGLARNADLLAGEIADLGPQQDRVIRPLRPGIDGQHDILRVAEGLHPEQRETVRQRPVEPGLGQVLRTAPVHRGRVARLARRAPVDLPARLKLEVQPQVQAVPALCGRARHDQAQARLLLVDPGAGRGARCAARARQDQAKRQKQGSGDHRRAPDWRFGRHFTLPGAR